MSDIPLSAPVPVRMPVDAPVAARPVDAPVARRAAAVVGLADCSGGGS
jgi:hypothetical protein